MLHLRERVDLPSDGAATPATLTLTCADRRRSRLRAKLNDGREVAVMLPRGSMLRDGECLFDPAANVVVVVRAAPEALSIARTSHQPTLCRAAYHLGNRHVPVQLGADWLAYEHDRVLDQMVRAFGLSLSVETRPFEPEAGAYGSGRSHGDDHPHEHTHPH